MSVILYGVAVMVVCGIGSLLCKKSQQSAAWVGFSGLVCGALLVLFGAVFGNPFDFSLWIGRENLESFRKEVLICVVPLLLLAPVCGLHALDYVHERKHVFWFFFNLLVASITLLPIANIEHPIFFLALWEVMGWSSFALVCFEQEAKGVQKASWLYMLSAQAGALCLILLVVLLKSAIGESMSMLIFWLAVVGFGLKSGFAFLHFWLPPAHAAAPAPVSALMSGAMNNMGILGIWKICSTITERSDCAAYCGWVLLTIGVLGAVGAIIFALAQTHLKRIIAYSSVENFGIMALALGFVFIGEAYGLEKLKFLSMWALVFHLFNHTFLKGLLFLSAGAVHIGAGTYKIERLGGLIKRMPMVGAAFLFGSIGISGIPPLNLFFSEAILYYVAFLGVRSAQPPLMVASIVVILALALIGGVATAVFTKASGVVFLGEARTGEARNAKNVPLATKISLGSLVFSSLLMCVYIPLVMRRVDVSFGRFFSTIEWLGLGMILLVAAGGCVRRKVSKKKDESGQTWDCGYSEPTARMQYTGNSFSLPLEKSFHGILATKEQVQKPEGFFPKDGKRSFSTKDISMRLLWHPLFRFIERIAEKTHRLQSGHLHIYIFFMVSAIFAMLIWAFCF